jgi:very-short-patch-repair endonuclease
LRGRVGRGLWRYLRSRSLAGFKFARQEPIGPYVADFVCREQRLVIKVDGGQHADNRRDAVGDHWLVEHRYRVLRFWNIEVLGNIEGVWDTIFAAAFAAAPPHPAPLPRAGRGSRQATPPNEKKAMTLAPLLAASSVIQLHAFAAMAAFALGIVQLSAPKGTVPFGP